MSYMAWHGMAWHGMAWLLFGYAFINQGRSGYAGSPITTRGTSFPLICSFESGKGITFLDGGLYFIAQVHEGTLQHTEIL